jgi:hypothetical protein
MDTIPGHMYTWMRKEHRVASGDPYCSNCGYSLTGLTESSRCPECGKPLVEILQRRGGFMGGRRYTSNIHLFGLPLLQVAFGPHGDERIGRARAIFAMGDVACGWFALGGRCRGIVALGGMAVGVVAIGGVCVGLLALGGVAAGGLVAGGIALGLLANGGLGAGWIVQGGLAIGYYARGGKAIGQHVVSATVRDAEALELFREWGWLLGTQTGMLWVYSLWLIVAMLLVAGLAAIVIGLAYVRRRDETEMR